MNVIARRSQKVDVYPIRREREQQDLSKPSGKLVGVFQGRALFLLMVVLPVLLSSIYFGIMASSVYVSETKYVVRTPSDSKGSALSGFVHASGVSKSTDDAHVINAFFQSRDAMEILRRDCKLDEIYSSGGVDFLSRYPRPWQRPSSEALFKYYLSRTTVKYDKNTGISTLFVAAFDPVSAQAIARRLMEGGEAMANRLTVRMRTDLVNRANTEAEAARRRAIESLEHLTAWRNREQQVDPTRYSTAAIEVIARLSLETANLRAQLNEIESASPQNPSLTTLRNRIGSLERQIDLERRLLAGDGGSLAPKIVEYEQLQLERHFAERLFAATVSSQESARAEAQRQQIYIERVVEPGLPDYPLHPYRLISIFATLVISILSYMIASKILKNISRHGLFARYFRRSVA